MKYIKKQENPPSALENWKSVKTNSETLEKYYQDESKKGSVIWNLLNSGKVPEHRQESDIVYFSKQELREILIKEQGSICCYCGKRIYDDHTTIIEHLEPKSENKHLTFDYFNLLASCDGGLKNSYKVQEDGEKLDDILQKQNTSLEQILHLNEDLDVRKALKKGDEIILQSRDAHCDHKKGSKTIDIKPTQEDCENRFVYEPTGFIKPKTANDNKTIETIKQLGLNDNQNIIKGRAKAWKRAIDMLYPLRKISQNPEMLKNLLKQLHDNIYQINEKEELREYCFVEKAFLKKYLE